MNRIKSLMLNLKLLFTDDFVSRWQAQDERLDVRLDERARELRERADAYERAVDGRIDERLGAIDTRVEELRTALEGRLDEYQAALDSRIEERLVFIDVKADGRTDALEKALNARADGYETAITKRLEHFEGTASTRANRFESTISARLDEFETEVTHRGDRFEAAMDERTEKRFLEAEARLDARLEDAEKRLDGALGDAQQVLDARFDERERKTDIRFDDRLVRTERYIDSRFDAFEKATDSRLETHERMVDGKLHQRSQDIIDRTDLMLQILDQRLDKFRREIRALGGSNAGNAANANKNSNAADLKGPAERVSFRKLAEAEGHLLATGASGSPALYHQILEWKQSSEAGIYDFTADEQEIADYILSFQSDAKEVAYVKHHMRRFLTTIKRIPPAQSSSERILELGSLGHLTPVIKKLSGYSEFLGGDYWKDGDAVSTIVVEQPNGGERVEFELRNFNVETDAFPYPDGFFRTVLCCELLEHLISDPMHMLWECNRVLQSDGVMLVSTPNIASCHAIEGVLTFCTPFHFSQYNIHDRADQHNREYSPIELQWALEAAGFKVILMETEDVWLRSNPAILDLLKQLKLSTELRGDNLFALATKTSAPVDRYPGFLYAE